jgi:transposase
MLHAGLDLSRTRLDYCLLDDEGGRMDVGGVPPDGDGLRGFARLVQLRHGPVAVRAAIESMNGARFVHDTLERCGWEVEVADAQKVKGLAPLACKTDRIDAWVLAELSRRDLVPTIWLPSFELRAERERARWRLFLVRKRSSLKHRVHAQLLAFGHRCPVSDLFGRQGRELLARLDFPEPWRSGVLAAVAMIDDLDREIAAIDRELRRLGADHAYIPLLLTVPGIAWVLGYTIAAEIGDIHRFASPAKLCGYTGLCPAVYQSGGKDRRGHLTHAGPRYLRWALIEAASTACRHPVYRARYQRNKARLGKQRGAKVAQVDIARRLAEAIWHMLTRNRPFAPAGATPALAA